MQPVYLAALRSWAIPPAATFAVIVTALVYLRGWWLLRRAGSRAVPPWRAVMFLAGLLTLWIALASPMDVFNSFLLTAHMLQHMLLMMVAPPLILLGAPLIPLVRGLPIFAAREFAGPFLNWPVATRVGRALTHPVVALLLMGAAMFAWHTPALYELALRSAAWHQFEHACFFLTSLIFWWPVIQPWPSRPHWPRWAMVPYLLVADLQNTVLSAILAFSDRVLYPSYTAVPRLFGLSPLEDQVASGAVMWVLGSVAFLIPAIVIAVQCLSKKPAAIAPPPKRGPTLLETLLPDRVSLPFSLPFKRLKPNSPGFEALIFVAFFLITGIGFAALLTSGDSDEDSQAVVWSGINGPFLLTVFGPSEELRSGPNSLSVLVQDAKTSEPLLDAKAELLARPSGGGEPLVMERVESENALLQTMEVNLPNPGRWEFQIAVQDEARTASAKFPLPVAKAEAEIQFRWAYVGLAVLAAILCFSYLRRSRATKSADVQQTVAS